MKIIRWKLLAVASVLLVVGVSYMASDRRDLEVALKVSHLPWSLRKPEVRVDNWTDYSVAAHFEIAPEDLRRLLTLRPYTEVRVPEAFDIEMAQFRPPPSFDEVPKDLGSEVKRLFEWEEEEPFVICRIWVNPDFSKAFVQYAAD